MSWKDRIAEAAYTAPDGTRQTFDFEDVRMNVRKKTTAHEFTSLDGTYVEDQGLAGDTFPMRVYFHGPDHDLEAETFMGLLKQRGNGRLEHPKFGVHTVNIMGDIQRSDALVSEGNQTIFTLTFWTTVANIYPSADADTLQLVDDAVNSFDADAARQFEDSLEVDGAAERATFVSEMKAIKDGARTALRAAQDGTGKLQSQMDRIDKAIDSTLETFVGGPLLVATQLRRLAGAPARSAQLLRQRLDAYGNLANSLFEGKGTGAGGGTGTSPTAGDGVVDVGSKSPATVAATSNRFHVNRVMAEVVVLAYAQAVTGETYRTRQQALTAALELAELHDSLVEWSEANYAELLSVSPGPDASARNSSGVGSIDIGDSRTATLTTVTRAMAYLINTSFTLGLERSVLLDSPRNPIELCAELYGRFDDELYDEFTTFNDFNADEQLLIPPGTVVKYYAD